MTKRTGSVDTTYLVNALAGTSDFSLEPIPGLVSVTSLTMNVRLMCHSGGVFSLGSTASLRNGATAVVSFAPTVNGGWVTSSSTAAVSLTPLQYDGLVVRVYTLSCASNLPVRIAEASVDVTYTTSPLLVSGTALAPETDGGPWSECDGFTPNVTVASNGSPLVSVPCSQVDGSWSTTQPVTQDDVVTAYLDDGTAAHNGAVVRRLASHTPVSGLDIHAEQLRVDTPGSTVTNADIAVFDSNDDLVDLPMTVTAGTLSSSAPKLVVAAGEYEPTGNVTTPRLRVDAGATYTGAAETLELSGSGTGGCTAGTAARPMCVSGTFAGSTNTTRYTGTAATAVAGVGYANLALQPTSGSPTYDLGAAGATTITATSMTIGNGSNAVTASTSAASPTVTVSGALTVATAGTLTGAGTGTIAVAGDVTGGGAIDLAAGTFAHRPSATARTMSATGAGSPWSFATLEVATAAGGLTTVTIPAASRPIHTKATLRIGAASGQVTLLTASAMLGTMAIGGDLVQAVTGRLTAPAAMTIAGNFARQGTGAFTPGTGTITFVGSGTSTLTYANATSFYRLTVATPGKTLAFDTSFTTTVTNLFTATGSCGDEVFLRSDVATTAATLALSTVPNMTSVGIRDLIASTGRTAANSASMGGTTTGWTFPASTCPAPDRMWSNTTDASAGAANNATISADTFHVSFRNQFPGVATAHQTQIRTTPMTNVVALWHLDSPSPLVDAGPNNIALAATGAPAVTYPTSAGFGTAVAPTGTQQLNATANAALQLPIYTMEARFRTSNPGASGSPHPTIVSRQNVTNFQSNGLVYFETGCGCPGTWGLRFEHSVNGGTVRATVPVSAAGWLDNQWHHVAATYDGTTMRLYVDGQEVSSLGGGGAVDLVAGTRLTIGNDLFSGGGGRFTGEIDEVRISSVARSAAEIEGYAETGRPHDQLVWDSGSGGTAFGASCATVDQCSDVVYGGASIQHVGARYYATQRVRSAASVWSQWSTLDWFEFGLPPDTTAPLPNPMTATAVANSPTQITWTAATATDETQLHPTDPYSITSGAASWQPTPVRVEGLLSPNTQYTRTVRARDAAGNESTGTVQRRTWSNPPSSPTAVAQNWNAGPGYSVNLAWSAPAGGASSYRIRWSSDAYGSVIASPAGTSHTVTGLSASASYSFKICSVNGDGVEESTCSSIASVTTPPAPPTTSTNSLITDRSASITWSTVAGAVDYQLVIADGAGCPGPGVGYQTGAPPYATGNVLLADRTYTYRLRSIDASGAHGESSACFELSSATKRTGMTVGIAASVPLPAVTPGNSTTATSTISTTTWGATGYSIEASVNGLLTSGSDTVPATVSGTVGTPGTWIGTGFGFTVVSGTGIDPKWGAGANYAAMPLAATTIHSTGAAFSAGSANTTNTVVRYRLDPDASQAPGAYTALVTYSVVPLT